MQSYCLKRYLELFNSTGHVVPRARSNGPRRLLGQYEQLVILRLITEVPKIYLLEIQEELNNKFGVEVNAPTSCRMLKFMECS